MKELIALQKALHVSKDQQGHKYVYRKVDDIIEAYKKIAPGNVYLILTDDLIELNGSVYTRSTAIISNGEASVSASGHAKEGTLPGQSDPQISGSCSTYARKKALEGLFALDDNEDDVDSLPETAPKVNEATEDQIKTLNDYMILFESSNVKASNAINDILAIKNISFVDAEKYINRAKDIEKGSV